MKSKKFVTVFVGRKSTETNIDVQMWHGGNNEDQVLGVALKAFKNKCPEYDISVSKIVEIDLYDYREKIKDLKKENARLKSELEELRDSFLNREK